MERDYQFDSDLRIWKRIGAAPLPYSDGDEIESRLFRMLRNAINVSSSSPEISAAIQDWPSEYHFSPVRHNILRPFTFKPSNHILELGCGCGSITRYLGESGATVISVEGSQRRAKIAAERCRDLPNVTIYCDNITEFTSVDKFDYVTLIGVLEYAPKFIESDDPVGTCLKQARSYLKDDGILILAIENQLGLKYFNGCSEEHIGIPYFGVNGLYRNNDPVTFGRYALAEKLNQSGLPVHEFFYPFPDYKLPGLILSEASLRDGRLNIPDLLIHNTGRNYPETHHRAFAEDLAWRVAADNRLLADLANSFLILARPSGATLQQSDWLAKMYSRGPRYPRYQVESTIAPDATGGLAVRKRKLFPDAPADCEWMRQVVGESAYLAGNLLVGNIHKAMAREAGLDELAACFAPWLKFLLAHAARNEKGEQVLPENFVDCIPANLIETPSGKLRYFDAEWIYADQPPLAWTVIRGIFNSINGCLENSSIRQMTYRQFISFIAEKGGIPLQEDDFVVADHLEARLRTQCLIDFGRKSRLADSLDSPLQLIVRMVNHPPNYRDSLAWHQAELARIKATVSWRITKPLRAFWNVLRS